MKISTESPHQRRRSATSPLLLLIAFSFGLAGDLLAADAFYEEQLRRGQRDYEIGNFEKASKVLRIAAFGLLDEPERLVECLLFLGLSQAATNDREAFDASFERIVEIEERFSAYTRLDRPRLKRSYEETVVRLLPPDRLRLSAGFSSLPPPIVEKSPDPKQVRQELRRRLEEEPNDIQTMRDLAALERQLGRDRRALELLDRIAELEPEDASTQCARLELAHERRRCEPALGAYQMCETAALQSPLDAFLLGCMLERGLSEDAGALITKLPGARRADLEIADLAIESLNMLIAQTSDLPPAQLLGEGNQGAPDPAVTGPSQAGQNVFSRIRDFLASGGVSPELEEIIRLAADLAERHPDRRELQFLAAEAVYRAGRWQDATELYRQGGEPGIDQPMLLFHFAVSLFESDEREEAAAALEGALPALERTAFVDSYVEKILVQ